jgi:hypothetical protein
VWTKSRQRNAAATAAADKNKLKADDDWVDGREIGKG